MQFRSCVSDDWNNAAVTRKEVKRKRLNLSPCKKDLGDGHARCSLERFIPQPPWLNSLLVGEV